MKWHETLEQSLRYYLDLDFNFKEDEEEIYINVS